ncbi:glutamine--fructose-6-phosphate aminotransferase [Helicobacter enhydrae]|uniref:Glutamine--fructose-6-phosphate aminotransferase [isomerizing] n=1 Tax=Helicobacter enhydrae TaxID=222136 RepID=A0A1B1U5U8_9HELI|nr:glutamine--fructose-6-phosphate transaminase (isomerizing) [Helicobacter enhydrae]ANV98167.1 glutamine--fructose-6-phosphate aminotransferase [Helicobacter enhydrae]
MCGIVGYIGNAEKKDFVFNGLKELEYRGYDSAGMSVLTDGELSVFKAVGRLENLVNKCKDFTSSGFGVAIGHTRWATHGKPTEANAHPHIADFSSVIHNGIIENHKQIREELEKKGHRFISQTDTEVIVHLFEEKLKEGLEVFEAFESTIAELRGAYAILLITKKSPNRIFYAKNSSPLIIGRGQNGVYFASSDAPLIGYADEVCYLNDGSVGYIDESNFGALVPLQKLDQDKSYAQKEGFRYFMEKEIYEQSSVLLECMMGRANGGSIALDDIDSSFFQSVQEIVLCACGTSYHAAMVGKYLLERYAKIKTSVVIASEFRYASPMIASDALFVAISQSGETLDTLEAIKFAKSFGSKTLAICNVDNSSIVRECDEVLLTRAGIEKGVASTKAFATQVMVLWMMSCYLGKLRHTLSDNEVQKYIETMISSAKKTEVCPKIHDKIRRISKRYLHGHGFFFIGRDVFYPLALESALKLKEISYLHAEGYPSGEMKHGPIALADSELFTVALMPQHLLYEKIKSNAEELSARDATICAVSAVEFEGADDMIYINPCKHYMEEFFSMMVVLQLFALEVAVRLGNDVDMPRNLAKSVTVE